MYIYRFLRWLLTAILTDSLSPWRSPAVPVATADMDSMSTAAQTDDMAARGRSPRQWHRARSRRPSSTRAALSLQGADVNVCLCVRVCACVCACVRERMCAPVSARAYVCARAFGRAWSLCD